MKSIGKTLCGAGFLALALGAAPALAKFELIGINVAGAEFTGGELPGKHGTHYFFPEGDYFEKWSKRGIHMVRFPIKWERLQPELKGDFDDTYAELIDDMLDQAARYNIRIILDVHNYARYRGEVIGSEAVPFDAYRDLMAKIAERWHEHDALYAYDIMNEPHGAAEKYWPEAAQAGIDGVRQHDSKKPLYIEGVSWSSAARWPRYGDDLLTLKDPADNMVFSAHIYIDPDASGQYKKPPGKKFDPMIGVRRAEPFVGWLKENDKRGHIGEFGIPADNKAWLEAMDNLLAYLGEHCIPISYWAAGPSWGNYKLSIEPREGEERPQLDLLEKYVKKGNDCKGYGPN